MKKPHWLIKKGREECYDINGVKTWCEKVMCSKCGYRFDAIEGHLEQYNFCPSCGIRNTFAVVWYTLDGIIKEGESDGH